MIQDNDSKVLSDLSRIVSRYGPEPFMRLAELIRDPQRADALATTLESVAKQSPKAKSPPSARKTDGIGVAILNGLREVDPPKYELVADFRERLVSGTLLRSMSDIRRFAREHNLSIGRASSRKSAIPPLLRAVSELETSEIAALLASTPESMNDDRSLERWRELIVKPRNQSATAAEKPVDS